MHERMAEWTFTSAKQYADPFNDVEVDVVFERDDRSWRVPAFWRGGQDWTVRFAPPEPGVYRHRRESTDPANPDLTGHEGEVVIHAYRGTNALLRRGAFRVSDDGHHFEQADGTPFSWLADTWWTGMSDRLNWEGFQKLTADRKAKGFTAVQFVAGLVPFEELPPSDPGFGNEGGFVWGDELERINPGYFDFMDRRVQHLLDSELAPVIVGAWNLAISQVGLPKLRQHWRYLIARYGAYPVFWIVGGEVIDPPPEFRGPGSPFASSDDPNAGEWTELVRYVHATDPYRHPVSVHEVIPDYQPIQDETLLDFRFFQPAHFGEGTLATEVALLNIHYARTVTTKPLIVAEIGYEGLGAVHLEDFQRKAFWLGMLNGAAGHSYGANGVWEAYSNDKPLHRLKWSFVTWEQGMHFAGSRQVGLGARLLRTLPWSRFEPRPDWITPGGTTLLEPRDDDRINGLRVPLLQEWDLSRALAGGAAHSVEESEWRRRGGNLRLPYAAGVPGEARVVYIPSFGLSPLAPPTVLGLEPGVRYRARYWDAASGVAVDLGVIGRPEPGAVLFEGALAGDGPLALVAGEEPTDGVVTVEAASDAETGIVVRHVDDRNFVTAVYSPADGALSIRERIDGVDGEPHAVTVPAGLGATIRLSVEVREEYAAAALSDGHRTFPTPIIPISATGPGGVGLAARAGVTRIEVRESPALPADGPRNRKVYDAEGIFRGELTGPAMPGASLAPGGWGDYATRRILLLDAYLPEKLPGSNDWLLILEVE